MRPDHGSGKQVKAGACSGFYQHDLCFRHALKAGDLFPYAVAGLQPSGVMAYTIWTWAKYGTPSGYATIVVLMSFMFAMLFVIVGIIEYIAILFSELKDRPIYIVKSTESMESEKSYEILNNL